MIRVQNVKDIIFNISLSLVFLGVIVFSMSFAGCLGALRENLCLLKLYSLMLLILFIGEIVLSTVAFVFPNSLSHYLKDTLAKDPLMKYRDDANLQNLIDVIQRELKCCGISDAGYKDWSQNIYFNCSVTNPSPEKCAVPYSCCRNPRNFDVSNVPLPRPSSSPTTSSSSQSPLTPDASTAASTLKQGRNHRNQDSIATDPLNSFLSFLVPFPASS